MQFDFEQLMKIFLDTEFTGLTQSTSLISLALIDEANRTFYAEFTDYNTSQLNPWLKEHVISNLILEVLGEDVMQNATWVKGTRELITSSLHTWLTAYKEEGCQFVADVLMYDWVLFAELFGGALNLPDFVDFIPLDFSTMLFCKGIDTHKPRLELLSTADIEELEKICPNPMMHNALFDTYVMKMSFNKFFDK
ncbi:MAG: 3'-5' exoribonuclease [Bacteroidetes bacterium]|nr:3'-5' exoribonuclease [Bacteroidota bacterium]